MESPRGTLFATDRLRWRWRSVIWQCNSCAIGQPSYVRRVQQIHPLVACEARSTSILDGSDDLPYHPPCGEELFGRFCTGWGSFSFKDASQVFRAAMSSDSKIRNMLQSRTRGCLHGLNCDAYYKQYSFWYISSKIMWLSTGIDEQRGWWEKSSQLIPSFI
ncbi:unnamed protein product [Strongylus vulgaris]|uniref:Uncharacterized protein n=1 Tax=Strongylus vulgaris TaxID=40348 RepID=A0A3P7K893_STRVU|nr:unnamed protein product [Strongylus vulgaris]